MDKNNIVERLAVKHNLPIDKIRAIWNDFIEIIVDELSEKEENNYQDSEPLDQRKETKE